MAEGRLGTTPVCVCEKTSTRNCPVHGQGATTPVCERCDGDGYTESWNADQSDVVITLCTDCGPAPGVHDG